MLLHWVSIDITGAMRNWRANMNNELRQNIETREKHQKKFREQLEATEFQSLTEINSLKLALDLGTMNITEIRARDTIIPAEIK